MKKVLIITLFAAVAFCTGATMAAAQGSDTGTVTINVHIGSHARLTLNGNHPGNETVTFLDQDPFTNPTVTGAPAIAVSARVRTTAGGAITLTVQANQDLTEPGGATIPIGNISWAANGQLSGGALDYVNPVSLGAWNGGGIYAGTQTYVLVNDWVYVTGDYTAVVTYTLTAA